MRDRCTTRLGYLMSKVDRSGNCWLWTGMTDRRGYSRWSVPRTKPKRFVFVHRLLWEWTNGPVPEGLELDHLCRTHACVNPEHLEAVTHSVNMRRGRILNAVKTHCPRGHRYDLENTLWQIRRENGRPFRQCRACQRDRAQRIVAKRQASYPTQWRCRQCGQTFARPNNLGRHLQVAGHGDYRDYLAA